MPRLTHSSTQHGLDGYALQASGVSVGDQLYCARWCSVSVLPSDIPSLTVVITPAPSSSVTYGVWQSNYKLLKLKIWCVLGSQLHGDYLTTVYTCGATESQEAQIIKAEVYIDGKVLCGLILFANELPRPRKHCLLCCRI